LTHTKIEGKAIEDYTNGDEKQRPSRRIVDRPGSAIWGRFIQLGGEKADQVVHQIFQQIAGFQQKPQLYLRWEDLHLQGIRNRHESYQPDKAYQPVFGIYSNDYAHLFYRFLYNYEDTPPVVDSKGLPVATSLMAGNRRSYQYLGSWGLNVINAEYPAWKQKIEAQNQAGDATLYELSSVSYESSESTTYTFNEGFTVSNTGGKGYATGSSNTVKYSANVDYTIAIPQGLSVQKITFNGYDNYDVDAYISKLNGVSYTSTDYVFPAKIGGTASFVTHTIDLASTPATGSIGFRLGSKQCCLIITLYCTSPSGLKELIEINANAPVKQLLNGRIVIVKDGKIYEVSGKEVGPMAY
jgi:hypothetical protein